ncbi:ribonuclease [Sphingomonas humi]|uniref:Uncharacterized protein n=1 Tax=Sphingomonas humi TaxID=335630 RepID=A0ABP7RI30_9SPHN
MPEWLVEAGIGETRFAEIAESRIRAARILPDSILPAGSVVDARLIAVAPQPLARLDDGQEVLLTRRPGGISEGARFPLQITRPALPGPEPWKRALGSHFLGERIGGGVDAIELPFPPAGKDRLADLGWDDLIEEASSGIVRFAGGELRLAWTPAMTVIDVDGRLPAADLAVAGARAAGEAILRLDLQGSIVIDLPTTSGKAPRQAAADALDAAMVGESFERTAVNGFGLLQVVRPRRRPSLLELALDPPAFAARALLRLAATQGHGRATLAAHPAVIAVIEKNDPWLATLSRQRGGEITLRADPSLAISGGHVS